MDRLSWNNIKFSLYGTESEREFDAIITNRYKEVFWEGWPDAETLYFDFKKRLAAKSKKICVPDGILLWLEKSLEESQVYVVEFELASHPNEHIINQLLRFKNAIDNVISRKDIIDAIVNEIERNEEYSEVWEAQQPTIPFYRGCQELFEKNMSIVLVVDDMNDELRDLIKNIRNLKWIDDLDVLQVKLYARIDRQVGHTAKKGSNVMALYPDGGNEWYRAKIEAVKESKGGKNYRVKWFDGNTSHRLVSKVSPVKDVMIRTRWFDEF